MKYFEKLYNTPSFHRVFLCYRWRDRAEAVWRAKIQQQTSLRWLITASWRHVLEKQQAGSIIAQGADLASMRVKLINFANIRLLHLSSTRHRFAEGYVLTVTLFDNSKVITLFVHIDILIIDVFFGTGKFMRTNGSRL